MLITRCLRDQLFKPGEPAVGRRLLFDDAPPSRVAAVIEDVHVRMPFMPSTECAAFHFGRAARRARGDVPGAFPSPIAGRRPSVAVQALFGASTSSQWVTVVPFDSSRRRARRRSCAGWW